MKHLNTDAAEVIFDQLQHVISRVFCQLNTDLHSEVANELRAAREVLSGAKTDNPSECDAYFDDMYVLECIVGLCERYDQLWKQIAAQEFTSSWNSLQDCLDLMRLIRRFSRFCLDALQTQLIELEKAYPYKLFTSVGLVVGRVECTICKNDIDSELCPHRNGRLYRGALARGVITEILEVDHVAIVPNPDDKRCTFTYEDTSHQFKVVRFISELINSRKLSIGAFGGLKCTSRQIACNHHGKTRRNERCPCGSGKKSKDCCALKAFFEYDEYSVLPWSLPLQSAIT